MINITISAQEQCLYEGIAAFLDQRLQGGVQRVVVLLDKVTCLVANGAREVANEKAIVVAQLAMFFQLGFSRKRQPKIKTSVREHSNARDNEQRHF